MQFFIPFLPFKLTQDKPTTFEVIFISNGVRYGYSTTFNSEQVLTEGLYTYPKGKQKKVFEREYISEKNEYKYSYSREYQSNLKDIESKSLANKFFLSTAAEWSKLPEIKDSIDFFANKVIINTDYLNPNW